jgi:hypothetical protein
VYKRKPTITKEKEKEKEKKKRNFKFQLVAYTIKHVCIIVV